VYAIATPFLNMNSLASGSPPRVAKTNNVSTAANPTSVEIRDQALQTSTGKISPELLNALGIRRPANIRNSSARLAASLENRGKLNKKSQPQPNVGQPLMLNARSALSAALIASIGGRDNQFSEVALIADWDGREDCTADRGAKVDDFSNLEPEIDFTLTRTAISEHTVANGFNENVFYYGDSVGNLWVGTDTNGDGNIESALQINVPALVNTGSSSGVSLLNPTPGDCTDDQVTVTGIAVNPVADLGDFGLCGAIGEVVYVSTLDTEGCASNGLNQPIRTRIFCLGLADCQTVCGTVTAFTPATLASGGSIVLGGAQTFFISAGVTLGNQNLITVGANICLCSVLTTAGRFAVGTVSLAPDFGPVIAPVGARQILRTPLSNIAGVAVDDDSNLYFQLLDLINIQNGGAIFKVTETPRVVPDCGAAPRINRVIADIPDGLAGSIGLTTAVGSSANPVLASGGFRLTNYSGQSTTFGNIVALATGAGNVVYAAAARSLNPADDARTQETEGAFVNPPALGATPSIIISFADCSGGFDSCSSPASSINGALPIADGFADVAQNGLTRIPGVNNFRLFALGNGPDIRPATGGTAVVPGTPASVLKIDMQIDFTIHSGIAVNEAGTVFVISGGTPAGIKTNPSPLRGEILCFEDMCPMDRRADFIDLRGDVLPNPPSGGDNFGDGDSDRFDHIFHQAPLDTVTVTPAGLAGLARGFLRYTNRLAPNPISPGVTLGVVGGQGVQGDDDTSGPIFFENLDPGHQVSRGFEFLFGAMGTPGSATMPCANNVWDSFFLNSNGNITFGGGDTDESPSVPEFRSGLPKLAPAWADLNPNARAANPINFPVQALGFANVNAFRVRWLNVPEFKSENCSTNSLGIGGNTMAITAFNDGVETMSLPTGCPDDDCNLAHARCRLEGRMAGDDFALSCQTSLNFCNHRCKTGVDYLNPRSTALLFNREPNTGLLIGCPRRLAGTGHFIFDYARMDILGTPDRPVITGYSEGGASPLNPPGLCETNLSLAAANADSSPFKVIDGQTASIQDCLIGEGTEPHIFELFNEGRDASIGAGGEIVLATPDFDLRFEGNDPALCSPLRQGDDNRSKVGFFGKTCPPDPIPLFVTPVGTLAVAPGQPAVGSPAAASSIDSSGNKVSFPTSGIINVVCVGQLNILGCGFFPNEITTICPGFNTETGVPLQRPGKTVSTSAAIACDTNGDGILETIVQLANVTPVNRSLVRATLTPLNGSGLPGTAFPLACCGGFADLILTTTFTAGDNNQFGTFTKTATQTIDLGARAPVVLSVTSSEGNCSLQQDLLISGTCFILPQGGVTSVFAVERNNPANVIQASRFFVVNANLIDALFNFGGANTGRTFLIFVTGPGGTSRNLTTLPQGTQAGCPLGNEQGVQVTFTCTPIIIVDPPPPPEGPLVFGCDLKRSPSGVFSLVVVGRDFRGGATVTVGGRTPKKIQFKDRQADSNLFNKLVLKGGICRAIPGAIVVTNPGGRPSVPFQCNRSCPTQN
jgi:hypothetical protein